MIEWKVDLSTVFSQRETEAQVLVCPQKREMEVIVLLSSLEQEGKTGGCTGSLPEANALPSGKVHTGVSQFQSVLCICKLSVHQSS